MRETYLSKLLTSGLGKLKALGKCSRVVCKKILQKDLYVAPFTRVTVRWASEIFISHEHRRYNSICVCMRVYLCQGVLTL